MKEMEGMWFSYDGIYLVWEWETKESVECSGDVNNESIGSGRRG